MNEMVGAIKNALVEELGRKGHNVTLEEKEFEKNNGMKRIGLIAEEGEKALSPVLYLDKPIKAIEGGADTVEEVAKTLAEIYIKSLNDSKNINNASEKIMDKDFVVENVVPFLCNEEWNKDFLDKAPHREFANLAILYKVVLRKSEDGIESVKITDDLQGSIGITEEELYEAAMKNLEKEDPVIMSMAEMMNKMLGIETDEEIGFEDVPMIIVTNESGVFGANQILREDVQKRLCEVFKDGFYMLPSSIHEVLIVDKESVVDGRDLTNMVQGVNADHLAEDDKLADNAYLYNKEDKTFSLVA